METDDIFLGAFGLLRGGELESVLVRGTNGRRIAVFRIGGADDAEREYRRGPALVDLRLLKSEVRRLKDVAFEAIRQEERNAGHERGDRTHQGIEQTVRGRR